MEALQHFLILRTGLESYCIFFLLIAISSINLCNSDFTFITAGTLSSRGIFDYRILIILGFFALLTGDSITFFSGRKWGRALIHKKPFSFILNDEKMDRAEDFFKKKGLILLFFVRFLPFLRTSLFLTTGTLRVHPKNFYVLNALSSAIYLPLVIIGSNRAGANIGEIINTFKRLQSIPILLVLALLIYFILRKTTLKKKVQLEK